MPSIFDLILVPVYLGYLLLAQYSKVEESFGLQAIHDILFHKFDISKYDHLEFPGAVPRTFVGPLVVSGLVSPLLRFIPPAHTKGDAQLLARAMLGLINVISVVYLKGAVFGSLKRSAEELKSEKPKVFHAKGKKGKKVPQPPATASVYSPWSFGLWYTLFTVVQFHYMYYCSRTLPNFFALPLTNIAFAQMFKGHYSRSISILAFTSVVFRIEITALTLALGLGYKLYNLLNYVDLVKAGLIGGVVGCVLSGAVDSFFWQRLTIPEVESFIFNVIEGKSSEWGTEPFTRYFTNYLLSMFLPPHVLVLAVVGYFVDPTKKLLKITALASMVYVTLVSFQPHKEWRFIIYVAPLFTALGASGASYITSRARSSFLYQILVLSVFGSALVSFIIAIAWATISSYNYPGGEAMTKFHQNLIMEVMHKKIDPTQGYTVHVDVLPCMTGMTHFQEFSEYSQLNITYDRTEDERKLVKMWDTFDYLVVETNLKKQQFRIPEVEGYKWARIDSVPGLRGVNLKAFKRLRPLQMLTQMYLQKSPAAFFEAIKMFVVVEDKIFLYKKVPVEKPVEKKPVVEDP